MGDHPSPVATTIATWVYQLHASGTTSAHEGVLAACEAVAAAADQKAGDAAGMALIDAISEILEGSEPGDISAAASAIYGDRVGSALGDGERSERTARLRR